MGYKRFKIQIQFLFIATLVFIILMAASFWNVSKDKVELGAWPLIFLILSLISIVLFYFAYSKATDEKLIAEEINTQVNQARAQIIEEFSKTDETEDEINQSQNIKTAVDKILPKGKFKSIDSLIKKLFTNLASEFQLVCGIYYSYNKQKKVFSMQSSYALPADSDVADFKLGDDLNGQAAENQDIMFVSDMPEDYFTVESGLGKAKPRHLVIMPLIGDKKTIAVLEFATFIEMPANGNEILSQIATGVADKINQF